MYSLYGSNEALRNLYILAQPFMNDCASIHNVSDLKRPYLAFLSKTFPNLPINKDNDIFISNDHIEQSLAAAFSGSLLDDLNQSNVIGKSYSYSIKDQKIELARKALLNLLPRDEDFATIFSLVIHSIFITEPNITPLGHSSHGGSASGAIGSIWLSLHKKINFYDICELYVHELTHHLMFLDELVHGHFDYKLINDPVNYAYSSILNRSRPLDKVIHSMAVATEIVLARQSFLGSSSKVSVHPESRIIQENVLRSFDSLQALQNYDQLTTERSRDIAQRCYTTCLGLLEKSPEDALCL